MNCAPALYRLPDVRAVTLGPIIEKIGINPVNKKNDITITKILSNLKIICNI